jgi:hypothetical protein
LEPAAQSEAIGKIQKLLDEPLIDAGRFQKEMPLAKFLAALEAQLPKEKRISLRIDPEAFGNKLAEVAATPIRLPPMPLRQALGAAIGRMKIKLAEVAGAPIRVPPMPGKTSLRQALEAAIEKIKIKADYRIGPGNVALTTPERALYTAEYDIRGLRFDNPSSSTFSPKAETLFAGRSVQQAAPADPGPEAARLGQLIFSWVDLENPTVAKESAARIQVLNGTRLLVRTNAARHAQIADGLAAWRRLGDVAVIISARLYEVDHAFYKKVASLKRLSMADLEEMERQFLSGKVPKGEVPKGESLWELLKKQRLILTGEELKIDSGLEAGFMSWHQVGSCLPSPSQLRKGEKNRQAILEGVSFLARVRVSPDRRYVWLKLTEKSTELKVINKINLLLDNTGKEGVAEVPLLDETLHARTETIPDGGSIFIPVHYRPKSAQAKNRWWVLSITPRIWIEEEERQIQRGNLPPIPR